MTTRLQGQPLQVLLALVEKPTEVVTREELIARLWPRGVVDFDTSLNTAVRKLRIALNDDPEAPRYIETIPRRGYRFIAVAEPFVDETIVRGTIEPEPVPLPVPVPDAVSVPVSMAAAQPEPIPVALPSAATEPSRIRQHLIIGVVACIVVSCLAAVAIYWRAPRHAEPASIVVLPFVDMSTDQKDAALCAGITEELSNRLAQIPSLRVVARTSAYEFQGKNTDVRRIGSMLGATYLVEGSVRRDADKVRVTAQMVSTRDGYHVYSESFDFKPESVLDIELTLSRSVAQALRLWLSPELVRQWRARGAHSPEAFDSYIRARQLAREQTADADERAASMYRFSIERDPGFALAYVGLAEVKLNALSLRGKQISEVQGEVRKLLEAARLLNPDMPELDALEGWLLREMGQEQAAVVKLRGAVARNPSDAVSYGRLGVALQALGQARDAHEQFTRASELNPLDFLPQLYRCIALQELGHFDDAARACARSRALAPENYWGALVTGWLEFGRGNLADAVRWNSEVMRLEPTQSEMAFVHVDLLLTLGLVEEARTAARNIVSTDEPRLQLMNATLALADGGPLALRRFLEQPAASALESPATRVDLVRLHHTAGNLSAMQAALRRVLPDLQANEATLFDSRQVMHGYSEALICAAAYILIGEREHGVRLLDRLEAMLDRLEQNGWGAHGVDSLRAESRALRGDGDGAMRSLSRAVSRGWRGAWRARTEPYLANLWGRADFQKLMEDVEARIDDQRARFLALTGPSAAP